MDRDQEDPDSEKGERPVAYDSHLHVRLAKKLRSLGQTDRDLADAFNVPLKTLSSWRLEHPEFSAACKEPTSQLVQAEEALFKLATGYTYMDERPASCGGIPTVVKCERQAHPHLGALMFLLLNLAPHKWKHFSKITPEVNSDSPLAQLAKELEGTALRPRQDKR